MKIEKRLISIDEALEATHREPFWTESEAAYIRSFLVKLPKADAVEVVHGRWIWHEEEFEYECSACNCKFDYNHTFGIFDHGYEYGNYCPNCGAKMGGGNGDG